MHSRVASAALTPPEHTLNAAAAAADAIRIATEAAEAQQ